jgi:hypothetical protein
MCYPLRKHSGNLFHYSISIHTSVILSPLKVSLTELSASFFKGVRGAAGGKIEKVNYHFSSKKMTVDQMR